MELLRNLVLRILLTNRKKGMLLNKKVRLEKTNLKEKLIGLQKRHSHISKTRVR